MQILVAEDDLTARTILVGVLKKWGYDPVTVNNGLAAWEVLQQPDSPRLIILDWMMPEMDGLEVIRRVRTNLTDQPPYIILLTSKDEKGDIISGLDTGANDYVKKPFDNEELYARIRVGQRTIELQTSLFETQQNLSHLASHDTLTGILNRRAILEHLSKELARAKREGQNTIGSGLYVGFFDIDHFKQINDQHGHQAGDEVLCEVTRTMKNNLRVYDSVGRLGGDEFLVIAPVIDNENCQKLFDRLLARIANCRIKFDTGEVSVTVSIGVVAANAESTEDQLLDAADAAMYQAKHQGGNQVVFASKGGCYSTLKQHSE